MALQSSSCLDAEMLSPTMSDALHGTATWPVIVWRYKTVIISIEAFNPINPGVFFVLILGVLSIIFLNLQPVS